MKNLFFAALALAGLGATAQAHDTWVETNTNLIRVGDAVHIDLKLGNHGNEHRDFKLASKVSLDFCQLAVIAPGGKRYDIKSGLIDTGYAPKEGYWTTTFAADAPGLYMVSQTFDSVMSYAPERSIKNAKTFFLVSKSLDRVPLYSPGFDRKTGNGLELVPENNPVVPMGPGAPLKLRLYFKGQPLATTKVSFVPEGETLTAGFDKRYEALTNVNGRVTFTPKEGKRYLIVAHRETPEKGKDAAGESYSSTQYAATMSLFVPQICPCCGE